MGMMLHIRERDARAEIAGYDAADAQIRPLI
jgi:hypothetical protein